MIHFHETNVFKEIELRKMNKEEWWAMIHNERINERFAKELEATFEEYPGTAIVEALFDSDWGRGCRDHFGIEELRVSEQMHALIKQFTQGN